MLILNINIKKGQKFIVFALFLINLINLFLILFMIFIEHKNTHRVAIWLLVFTFLPILGFLIYLLLGVGIVFKKKRLLKIYRNNLISRNNLRNNFLQLNGKYNELQKFNLINNNSLLLTNENIDIFTNGIETFEKLKVDIKNAKESIYILSYIIADDNIGGEIKNLLIQKARKGLDIKIIYDSFGSKNTKRKYFKELKKYGISILEFFPPIFKYKYLQLDINYRNHRKIIIIDNKISYIGGINIRDDHLGRKKELSPWRDTHIRIVGESSLELLKVFISDINLCKKNKKLKISNIPKQSSGDIKAQVINSAPLYSNSKIQDAILKAIELSKKEIFIQSPYLILNEKIIASLKNAVFSGKKVSIIIPKLKDKTFVYNVTLYYAKILLEYGIKVYTYKGFIHSKCMLLDKEIFLVGSSNFDMRSFYLNFETSVLIYNKIISQKYFNIILNDIKNSEELTLNFYKKLPILKRLAISFSKLFAPIL